MKKNKAIIVIAVIAVLLFSPAGYAQGLDKIAQSGMKWLSIPIGARAAALGNAYTAGAADAGIIFWNPAGLALVEGGNVFINQTQWIAEIDVNAAAASYELSGIGTVGVHFMSVSWGTINATQFTGQTGLYERVGTFEPENFAIGVSYAKQISEKFTVGANLRYIHENLLGDFVALEGTLADPQQYTGKLDIIAFDLGTMFRTGYKDLRFGITVQNISAEHKYRFESFPLPLTFKFGVAMDLAQAYFLEEGSEQSLTLLVDAIHPRDFSERVHFGLEYAYDQMFFLRGGYKSNYDEEDISLGAGIRYGVSDYNFGVDYSFINFENFDPVHMFSFSFGF